MNDREAFEAWIKSEKPKTNLQKRDGRYLFADASSSWKAWQAATAATQERCAKAVEELDRQKWFPSQRDFAEACVRVIRKVK